MTAWLGTERVRVHGIRARIQARDADQVLIEFIPRRNEVLRLLDDDGRPIAIHLDLGWAWVPVSAVTPDEATP